MAKLFLSYSRKDAAKVERLCEWLERAGHEVWRDEDDISGGASFSAAIETALKECDAVVVLWSVNSVHSAWVRDEAGFGRDANKLIPLILDGTEPPLGFRQYQSIDVSKWKAQSPAANRVTNAIARVTGAGDPSSTAQPRIARQIAPIFSRSKIVIAVVAVLVLLGTAAGLFLWRNSSDRNYITIAVMASPTSPDRATATDYANVTAADMAAFLPTHFDGATVIPPSDATGITSGNRMLISSNPHGKGADATLTLSDTDGRTIIWSKSWSVPDLSALDLRQAVSRSASQAALCLTEAKGGHDRLVQPALGAFLSGCVGIGEPDTSDSELTATFERVVKLAPDFPRGWAYLATGRANAAEAQGLPPQLVNSARQAIATARELNPRSGLAYLAEAILIDSDRAKSLSLLDKGAEFEPDNALLQLQRTGPLQSFGLMADSVRAAKRAVELDPLTSFVRANYISALTYAGQFSRAQLELAEARKKWPNDPQIDQAEFGFQYRYGDPRKAEALMPRALEYSDARLIPYRQVIAARLNPSPSKVDEAISSFRARAETEPQSENLVLLALGTFGRTEDAYRLLNDPRFQRILQPEILFRPDFAAVRADPRFMGLAVRLGLVRYWRQSGKWPDYCTTEHLKYDCKTEAAKYRS